MPMIRIKCLGRVGAETSTEIWSRQIHGGHRVGEYEFTFALDDQNYDWLIVYDDMPRYKARHRHYVSEILHCPPSNTILVTSEPSSVRRYPRLFLDQFNYIVSSQEPRFIDHTGHILTQPGLRWYYGIGNDHILTLDDMIAHPPFNKSSDISAIVSSKKQKHTLHARRVDFIETIAKRLPTLERFGHGVRTLNDKAEALDPYRYHIAIENHIAPHHWTEKLSDAFLGCTLPFYIGAPNIFDYFPRDSLIPLSLDDPDGSVEIITKAISNQEWEKRLPAIKEARRLVIEQYGLFQNIAGTIENLRVGPLESHHKNRNCHILSAYDARRARPIFSFFERIKNASRFLSFD